MSKAAVVMAKSAFSGSLLLVLTCATCLVSLYPSTTLARTDTSSSTPPNVVFRSKPEGVQVSQSRKMQAAQSAVMGTSITIWTKQRFSGTYRTRRAVPGCENLVSPFKNNVSSLRIDWNVQDSFPLHSMCKRVLFWTETDCYGTGTYWDVPGDEANPEKYDYGYDEYSNFGGSSINAIECEMDALPLQSPPPPKSRRTPPPLKSKQSPPPHLPSPPPPPPPPKSKPIPPSPRPKQTPPPPKSKTTPPSPPPKRTSPSPPPPPPPKSKPTPSPPPPAVSGDLGCIAPHNAARDAVGVPGLVWSTKLVASATQWANKLRDDSCAFRHSGGPYGENLYKIWGAQATCQDATDSWVSEIEFYDYQSNTCADGEACGHYTQVVWKDTKSVGCARSTCSVKDNIHIWVCQYDPPGNYVGEWPY